jgi:bifunctional ADP-heptose synthase (sugar kinase/adenylyltransferase)
MIEKINRLKIAVIGDVMLDHYIFGNVDRISPEAPVPVLNVKDEKFYLGGAANVAKKFKRFRRRCVLS